MDVRFQKEKTADPLVFFPNSHFFLLVDGIPVFCLFVCVCFSKEQAATVLGTMRLASDTGVHCKK